MLKVNLPCFPELQLSQSAATKTETSPDSDCHYGLVRRLVPRVLLALAATLATLKLADVAVGQFANSRSRHLLRLAPGAHVRHKSNEFDYVFQANKLGLRGPDVAFQKPPGTVRIVLLGDSFVAGYGVAEEHLLTTLLEEKIAAAKRRDDTAPRADARDVGPGILTNSATPEDVAGKGTGARHVEVVNVGRVGTSTIRELDLYEAIGSRFHPDLVILAYYLGNDLAEISQEQTHTELAEWHPSGWTRRLAFYWCPNLYLELALVRQSRRQLREFTQRREAEIIDDIRREALARDRDPAAAVVKYGTLSPKLRTDAASGMLSEQRIVDACIEPDRLVRALDPDDAYFQRAWGRTKEHLDRLREAVTRDGARLVVVAIPAPFQLDRKSLEFHKALGYVVRESWLEETPRTAVALREWTLTANVPYLDLTDRFRDAEKSLYFIEDVHFTPEGNRECAQAICDFLQSRGLCP